MAREVYLYGDINDYSAEAFVRECALVPATEDVLVRIMTDGGEPACMWAMLSKLADMPNRKVAKVDGKAYSCGAFACLYMDEVESIDTAQFLIHRAAYSAWFEGSEYFTDALKADLANINKNLRKALEAKIDTKVFESVAKCTLDDVFSMDQRKDVFFSAQQAQRMGLIKTITKLTPGRRKEMEAKMCDMLSARTGFRVAAQYNSNDKPNMELKTLAELKANYPELYELAVKEGVTKEANRVNTWLVFLKADKKAVKKGIKNGMECTTAIQAELSLKLSNKKGLKKVEDDSPEAVQTTEAETKVKTEKEKKVSAFEAELAQIQKDRKGK